MIIIAEVSELSRKIKLPTDRVLSVNGDYQVDGIAFKLPATYDGDFDFSTAAARVHWTGVDKVEHTNLITEVDGNGYPLWTMPSELTQGGHGVIEFAVSFVATDETAAVTKRWISDPVSFRNRRTVNGSNEDEEAEEETTYDRLASAIATVRAAQAEVEDTNAVLSSLTGSAPVPVENRSDMVDDGHLYLYTGDETGLVTGNLYYYVNGTLTNGGQYGSMEVDATLTQSGQAADAKKTGDEISAIKEDLSAHEVRIEELEAGGSGGLSKTAVNLLNTILSEAVYGSDQTANIKLLYKELSNVKPVSITATLASRALVGMQYSELTFEITATFDDESTSTTTDGYRVTTTGTVHSGSNTVTVSYRGVTTNVTFEAEQVVTHTITYNLTDVSSSNMVSVVVDGAYYSTTLSVKTDYDFNGCTVTMGGVDITSSVYGNMEILIPEVTGDVVITASARAIVAIDDFVFHSQNLARVYAMRDESTEAIDALYNNDRILYGKHDVTRDTNVRIAITNNTGANISRANIYVGEIPAPGVYTIGGQNFYAPTQATVVLFNSRKISNASNTIADGARILADYTIHAGRRLALYFPASLPENLDIKISSGAYDMIDPLDGYTAINWTSGTYDVCDYYDGLDTSSTLLGTTQGPEFTTQALSSGSKYELMRYSETAYIGSRYFGFTAAPGTSTTRTEMEAFNSVNGGTIYAGAAQSLLKYYPYKYVMTSINGYYLIAQNVGSSEYYKEIAE